MVAMHVTYQFERSVDFLKDNFLLQTQWLHLETRNTMLGFRNSGHMHARNAVGPVN